MGAWGTGIFQDDTACDIRDEYKQLLGEGLGAPEAKVRILAAYKSSFDDPDESTVAWLALAAAQWKLGRLDADTLEHALQVIDSGNDLKRWNVDAKDRAKRQTVLDKLRAQITSPQPAEKKVTRERKCECNWQVGELVAWRLDSGRQIILRVIGLKTDKGGTYPYCEFLDWIGNDLPPQDVLGSLDKKWGKTQFGHDVKQLMVVGMNRKWAARAQRLNLHSSPSLKSKETQVVHWKEMDRIAKEWYQLE